MSIANLIRQILKGTPRYYWLRLRLFVMKLRLARLVRFYVTAGLTAAFLMLLIGFATSFPLVFLATCLLVGSAAAFKIYVVTRWLARELVMHPELRRNRPPIVPELVLSLVLPKPRSVFILIDFRSWYFSHKIDRYYNAPWKNRWLDLKDYILYWRDVFISVPSILKWQFRRLIRGREYLRSIDIKETVDNNLALHRKPI